jgi:hypothetical protein
MAQMDVRDGLDVHDQAADFASALMTEWGVGNRRCNDGVLLLLSKDPREVRACWAPRPALLLPSLLLEPACWSLLLRSEVLSGVPAALAWEALGWLHRRSIEHGSRPGPASADGPRCQQVYVYAGAGARERLTPDRILAAIDNMRPGLRAGDYDAALQRGAVDIGVVLAGGKIGGEGSGKWHSDLWIPGAFFSFVGALFGLSWWCAQLRGQPHAWQQASPGLSLLMTADLIHCMLAVLHGIQAETAVISMRPCGTPSLH